MEVKYVSPGKEVREMDCIEKIEGFKLDQSKPTGSKIFCAGCGTIFDTSVWTPGVLTLSNKEAGYKQEYFLCRDCSLRIMKEHIKEEQRDEHI